MTAACRNVCLVGMMGAGKTTVGRQLAKRLGWHFVDSDHEIEARTGVTIPTIFEIEGEGGFRRRESDVIRLLAQGEHQVLATGGGAVLDSDNRRHLREAGLVVYLRVLPLALFERTRHDRNRPLLQVADPLGKIEELFGLRDPLYLDVADIVIEGSAGGISATIRRIEQELRKRCEP